MWLVVYCYRCLLNLVGLPVLILFSVNARWCEAQSKEDSLTALLQKQDLPDTARFDALIVLYRLVRLNEEKAIPLLNEASSLSLKLSDSKRICDAHLRLASRHDYNGDLAAAHKALDVVREHLQDVSNPEIQLRYYYQLGILQYFEGSYDQAIDNFWKVIGFYETKKDTTGLASVFVNIGNSYKEIENLDKSLEYYEKGLDLYRAVGDDRGVSQAMGNIGTIYKARREFDKALEFYEQSLHYNEINNWVEDAVIDVNNIGSLYLDQNKYDLALQYFNRSYAMSRKEGLRLQTLNSIYHMGQIEWKRGNFTRAISLMTDALNSAKAENYRENVKDALEALAKYHEELGDSKTALAFRKEYELYRDSLINENHLNEVKELELKYETEKKDKQIELLAKEKELQAQEISRQSTLKWILIGGIGLTLLLTALIIFLYRQRLQLNKKKEELKEIGFKHKLVQLEMKALRAQINPHFIFNCLTSINRMIARGENEKASLYLRKFGKLVRLILENSDSEVSLANELELLESYVQLEQLRFQKKIFYDVNVDPTIDQNTVTVPPMVLQPFVENAIWHGLANQDVATEGRISIEIKRDETELVMSIEDNGVGRERSGPAMEDDRQKSRSLGIKITQERLSLFGRDQQVTDRIRIIDLKDVKKSPAGTRVEISIPMEQRQTQ